MISEDAMFYENRFPFLEKNPAHRSAPNSQILPLVEIGDIERRGEEGDRPSIDMGMSSPSIGPNGGEIGLPEPIATSQEIGPPDSVGAKADYIRTK